MIWTARNKIRVQWKTAKQLWPNRKCIITTIIRTILYFDCDSDAVWRTFGTIGTLKSRESIEECIYVILNPRDVVRWSSAPDVFFNPRHVSRHFREHGRFVVLTALITERSHADLRVHAHVIRVFDLKRAAGIALQQSRTDTPGLVYRARVGAQSVSFLLLCKRFSRRCPCISSSCRLCRAINVG